MKSLRGSKTAENLLTAFRNKTYDQQKYTNYASIATEQGYIQFANLFKQMAKSVNEHAKLIARFLLCSGYTADEICTLMQMPIHSSDTLTNLDTAALIQTANATRIYPDYARIAYDEKYLEVSILFGMIIRADENFGKLCATNAAMLENGTFFNKKEVKKWVCNRCGYVYNGYIAPEICPLCYMNQNYFEIQHIE